MQAWGGHTFEDRRPTELFPTRSGIVGLLGACLGIDRDDFESLDALGNSFVYAARVDSSLSDPATESSETLRPRRITDYHTVLGARRVSGKPGDNPVQSWRDYLCDAQFTVALDVANDGPFTSERLAESVRRPHYTPSLGRRSCPPAQPLFVRLVEALDVHDALAKVPPYGGAVYAEVPREGDASSTLVNRLRIRDVRVASPSRQFVTRFVCFYPEESNHVPEQA